MRFHLDLLALTLLISLVTRIPRAQTLPARSPQSTAPTPDAGTLASPPSRSSLATASSRPPIPSTPRWPLPIPGLATRVSDPGDGRNWTITTRVDPAALTVVATVPGSALAITFRRPRAGSATCQAQVTQILRTGVIEPFRTATPAVFAGPPWEQGAYRQSGSTHDAEFGCVRLGANIWLVGVIADPRAGVGLADAAPMAERLAAALGAARARHGYPLLLEASGLEIDDPSDEATWLLTGAARGFPLMSDAVSSDAGAPGGVTLAVTRQPGNCAAAWNTLRRALASEGSLVDRPGYVPSAFGARIRRIPAGERTREIYCLSTRRGATLVTAVFRDGDGDAMSRMAPMLRAIVTASARDAL